MSGKTTLKQENRAQDPRGTKAGWLRHALIAIGAVIAFGVDVVAPGWGRPTIVSFALFFAIIWVCREYWSHAWFWVTVALLVPPHLAAILYFRQLLNEQNIFGLFLYAVAEFAAFCVVVSMSVWLVSRKKESS
jgi:hypothetical protein